MIKYVKSTNSWKIKLDDGTIVRLTDADMITLIEGISGVAFFGEKGWDKFCDDLYELMDDLPRDWFNLLVGVGSSGVEGRGGYIGKYRLCMTDYRRAKRRRVKNGYLKLTVREKMDKPYEKSFLERYTWNVHVALVRNRPDWFRQALDEKSKFYKEPKLTDAEVEEMWEKEKAKGVLVQNELD